MSCTRDCSTWRCAAGSVGRFLEGGNTSFRALGDKLALSHQEAVGQHDQGQVTVQAIPAPTLAASPHLREVAQATLTFGILVELLDDPPTVRQANETLQGSIRRQIGVVPLDIAVMAWEGTLRKERSLGACADARRTASASLRRTARSAMGMDGDELFAKRFLGSLAPSDGSPCVLWRGSAERLRGVQGRRPGHINEAGFKGDALVL